ncbi:hypothetical protein ABPG75_009627 [Micractinium tetrahymenae]
MSSEHDEGAHVGDGFCPECYGLGHSKIEKRDVKGFREIFVRAFECEECGHKADEVQLAGQYAPQGVRLRLAVPQGDAATLARRVLKSDTATVSIPELEFEIGAGAYVPFAGDLATVADVLMQACKNLNMNQAERRAADADTAGKIDDFILELESYAAGKHAFTFVIEDVAGNSFVEGPDGGAANGAAEGGDPQLTVEHLDRTPAQDSRMGLAMPDEFLPYEGEQDQGQAHAGAGAELPASAAGRLILRVEGQAEAAAFVASYAEQQQPAAAAAGEQGQAPAGVEVPTQCGACGAAAGGDFAVALHCPAAAAVKRGFAAASVIVFTSCGRCSAAAAEVRSTGGVAPKGVRLRLRVEKPADLERAVLQSASGSIALPDVGLALSSGGEGGLATTVGQLISSLASQLGSSTAAAAGAGEDAAEWDDFRSSLRAFAALERPWTLEITDPLDCSLIGPAGGGAGSGAAGGAGGGGSLEDDLQLSVVRYERTPYENDAFGLAAGGGAAPIA